MQNATGTYLVGVHSSTPGTASCRETPTGRYRWWCTDMIHPALVGSEATPQRPMGKLLHKKPIQ